MVKVTSLEDLKATYKRVNKEMAGARIVAGAITTGEEAEAGDEPATVRTALRMPAFESQHADVRLAEAGTHQPAPFESHPPASVQTVCPCWRD